MRLPAIKRWCILMIGLLLLGAVCRLAVPARPPRPAPAALVRPSRPATPFERSLRRAWKLRSRALLAEIGERETVERWDPSAAQRSETELRRLDLVRDPTGDLRRAHQAAGEAAALARSPAELRRVSMLRLLIERDLGPHSTPTVQRRGW